MVRKALANAATGTNAEGAERALGPLDISLRRLDSVYDTVGTDDPALWVEAEGRGVVVSIVVDCVVGDTDDDALWDDMAVNGDAAREDFARDDATDGGGETHGLVDAGSEVGARGKGLALDNFLDIIELATDLLDDLAKCMLVADKIEQGSGHSSRGCV